MYLFGVCGMLLLPLLDYLSACLLSACMVWYRCALASPYKGESRLEVAMLHSNVQKKSQWLQMIVRLTRHEQRIVPCACGSHLHTAVCCMLLFPLVLLQVALCTSQPVALLCVCVPSCKSGFQMALLGGVSAAMHIFVSLGWCIGYWFEPGLLVDHSAECTGALLSSRQVFRQVFT
jgi:hypothetical protein